jgi:hypothetical protein
MNHCSELIGHLGIGLIENEKKTSKGVFRFTFNFIQL